MTTDRGMGGESNRHGDNRTVVHAVDEIADLKVRDPALTGRSSNRSVGCCADGTVSATPFPDAPLANDGQIAVRTARSIRRRARRAGLRDLRRASRRRFRACPLRGIDRLANGIWGSA
jgi:hypothetical protein